MTVVASDPIAGCPAEVHVRWLVERALADAPRATPDEVMQHFAVDAGRATEIANILHSIAIVEVLGVRTSPSGEIVLDYRRPGGDPTQMRVPLTDRDERLGVPRLQRAVSFAGEVRALRPTELSPEERRGVHAVFDSSYRDADHDYLDAQLDRLGTIAIATLEDEVVGFFIVGRENLDLPVLGATRVNLPGLTCIHPSQRRGGLMHSVAAAALFSHLEPPIHVLGAARFATPASFRGAATVAAFEEWPPENDRLMLYRHATDTQRAVGRALALAHGAADFDEEHFVCIGRGRPIGEPIVQVDAEPEYWELFDHVDRRRGDTLLWINWPAAPPDIWFT